MTIFTSSWPGLSRPSTSYPERESWKPGSSPGMTVLCESRHGHFLQVHQPRHAFARQRHQGEKFGFRKWGLFRGALHLDDAAVAGHHEIGVGIGFRVLDRK